jgi:hypothetical protein
MADFPSWQLPPEQDLTEPPGELPGPVWVPRPATRA